MSAPNFEEALSSFKASAVDLRDAPDRRTLTTTINWLDVADGAKATTQTIRSLLDYQGVEYKMENAPNGGVYLWTTRFGLEVDHRGEATYAPGELLPRTFTADEPFVKVFCFGQEV